MKNILLIFTTIALLASCATQPKTTLEKVKEVPIKEVAEDWYLFEDEERDYSIRFPETPTTQNQVVNSDVGELDMKISMLETTEENAVYITIVTDYPMGVVHSSKTEMLDGIFRKAIDGGMSRVNGKLLSETKIDLDGFEGRLAKVNVENGLAVITMKLYLIGSRLYILQTAYETGKDNSMDMNRFFDSFKVSEAFKTAARQQVTTSETASGWQLYESKAGGYKMTFPKVPIESKDIINSDIGKLNTYTVTCGADEDNAAYMVTYIDYPDSLVHTEIVELDPFYEGVISGSVGEINGKLLYAKNIQLNDVEGREAKISFEVQGESGLSTLRLFLVANRMYMIQTITETQKDANVSIGRFMDSFQFIE